MEDHLLLWLGALLLAVAVIGFFYRAGLGSETASSLKKEQRAALKRKRSAAMWTAMVSLILAIGFGGVDLIRSAAARYDVEKLNYQAAIEVRNDKDYGAGHTDQPVPYEMKIPTSGPHSPHDLTFGFYKTKPANENLVHNLEHGDIILYYHPGSPSELTNKLKKLVHYKRAGSGILAVPNPDVPEGDAVYAVAWTKTMELPAYDESKIGTFIYTYINKGPETIPPDIRKNGGTM
jgi:hypothetical protein